jgi:uncharacterized protein (TIGR02172 family)
MNVDLGNPISYGRTSEIYAWGEGQILKLFYDWFGLENIETERRITKAVSESGYPAPAVGEIVQIKDRYGLVYQRVHGDSMWRIIRHRPWLAALYGRRSAELQASLHESTLQMDLPSQRQKMISRISESESIPDDIRPKVLEELENLPDGDRLCHGDFWPGNILITPQGEIIIDWLHASRGNPLADVSRTIILCLGGAETSQFRRPFLSLSTARITQFINPFIKLFLHAALRAYLSRYFELRPGGQDEYRHWLPIIAAERLCDNIPELRNWLVGQIEERNFQD